MELELYPHLHIRLFSTTLGIAMYADNGVYKNGFLYDELHGVQQEVYRLKGKLI